MRGNVWHMGGYVKRAERNRSVSIQVVEYIYAG